MDAVAATSGPQRLALERELSGPGAQEALARRDAVLLGLENRIADALRDGVPPRGIPPDRVPPRSEPGREEDPAAGRPGRQIPVTSAAMRPPVQSKKQRNDTIQ